MSPSPARIRSTLAAAVDQPDDLRELRRFHKVLADVNRLRICRVLAEGPATVTELIDMVGLSQPLVSWHLSKLREVGLVSRGVVLAAWTDDCARSSAWPVGGLAVLTLLGDAAD
jgi:hypothetical protein